MRYDTDVLVDGLRVFNDATDPTGAPNTDGIDLVGSHDVFLTRLNINTGDDDLTATNPKTVRSQNTSNGLIIGVPESPIQNVTLNNVSITTASTSGAYIRLRNINGLTCSNVTVTPLHARAELRAHVRQRERADEHQRLRRRGAVDVGGVGRAD
jgi:polygalacturonase